ncbi:PaaX family transcriptional regulator C-terminal domain-containing protein [Nocardioides sp. AE5]|uniref:PaaX family transcriptional regulator n=1 Tax=Nocardioides sp. AE5 TaxID=2962573 RepID=UPI002880E7BE|nr:PaaX family transcriptional regulator C-terminal domain-containing protein [Nocardioides sp. AE5]MDT0202113.1 PaaX family transcriptional regulator C-terminal domain-containing protein [Nocardioides sp. AE5]
MRARSALFDVYGDLLRTRGNQAPVADLVRLLDPVGISAPAVRTAISRIVGEGWLEPVQIGNGRGYRATERGIARLEAARQRIYRLRDRAWDGRWRLVLLDPIRDRRLRDRVHTTLGWMGLAELSDGLWVSPWPQPDLPAYLEREGASAAHTEAGSFTPAERPVAGWDLPALGREYAAWLARVRDDVPPESGDPDRDEFAQRFHLVHEWRKFLFRDPGLPAELLPADFPGFEAATHFHAEADRLRPGAERFVDRILS